MRHVQSAELWKAAVQKLTQTLKTCLEEAGRPPLPPSPPPRPPLLLYPSLKSEELCSADVLALMLHQVKKKKSLQNYHQF